MFNNHISNITPTPFGEIGKGNMEKLNLEITRLNQQKPKNFFFFFSFFTTKQGGGSIILFFHFSSESFYNLPSPSSPTQDHIPYIPSDMDEQHGFFKNASLKKIVSPICMYSSISTSLNIPLKNNKKYPSIGLGCSMNRLTNECVVTVSHPNTILDSPLFSFCINSRDEQARGNNNILFHFSSPYLVTYSISSLHSHHYQSNPGSSFFYGLNGIVWEHDLGYTGQEHHPAVCYTTTHHHPKKSIYFFMDDALPLLPQHQNNSMGGRL